MKQMIIAIFVFFIINFFVFAFVILTSNKWMYSFPSIPYLDKLLVLGAGISRTGQPTKILEDRIISAATYIKTYHPKFIILSGTKNGDAYDEPASMLESLLAKDIVNCSIQLDNTGFSTLDSCINFYKIFGESDIVIVSQNFHLYRTIFISRLLGLHTYGLIAENFQYKKIKMFFWYTREFFAIPYNIIKLLIFKVNN